MECRATPEQTALAFAMDALRMRFESDDSHEDKVAMTVYALREFVDEQADPTAAALAN